MFPLKNLAHKGLRIGHQHDSPSDGVRFTYPIPLIFIDNLHVVLLKGSMVIRHMPPLFQDEYFLGYKQAHRREDDISIVNAGLRVLFEPDTSTIQDIQLSFGGMAPTTVMAVATSKKLIGM